MGKTDTFKKTFFENTRLPFWQSLNDHNQSSDQQNFREVKRGDYVVVKVNEAYSKSLICEPLALMNLQNYYRN